MAVRPPLHTDDKLGVLEARAREVWRENEHPSSLAHEVMHLGAVPAVAQQCGAPAAGPLGAAGFGRIVAT